MWKIKHILGTSTLFFHLAFCYSDRQMEDASGDEKETWLSLSLSRLSCCSAYETAIAFLTTLVFALSLRLLSLVTGFEEYVFTL